MRYWARPLLSRKVLVPELSVANWPCRLPELSRTVPLLEIVDCQRPELSRDTPLLSKVPNRLPELSRKVVVPPESVENRAFAEPLLSRIVPLLVTPAKAGVATAAETSAMASIAKSFFMDVSG